MTVTYEHLFGSTHFVFYHLTPNTLYHPGGASTSSLAVISDGHQTVTGEGGDLPGGQGAYFPNASIRNNDGTFSEAPIVVRGNVVTAGECQRDFGAPPFGGDPPSIGAQILACWNEGPKPFDPYPPECSEGSFGVGNSIGFCRLQVSRTENSFTGLTTEERYRFSYDYAYCYTCPNGPLRLVIYARFVCSKTVYDEAGEVVSSSGQDASYVISWLMAE